VSTAHRAAGCRIFLANVQAKKRELLSRELAWSRCASYRCTAHPHVLIAPISRRIRRMDDDASIAVVSVRRAS